MRSPNMTFHPFLHSSGQKYNFRKEKAKKCQRIKIDERQSLVRSKGRNVGDNGEREICLN